MRMAATSSAVQLACFEVIAEIYPQEISKGLHFSDPPFDGRHPQC